MSILTSFKKLVDPETARIEEAERKAQREMPKRDASGDGPAYQCKICGHLSDDAAYCPTCLADTMRPVKRR
jgi:rubrerythrin